MGVVVVVMAVLLVLLGIDGGGGGDGRVASWSHLRRSVERRHFLFSLQDLEAPSALLTCLRHNASLIKHLGLRSTRPYGVNSKALEWEIGHQGIGASWSG